MLARPNLIARAAVLALVTATHPLGATERAVIAVVDTGINPYHAEFRDDSPDAFRHPSEYLPAYPVDAVALPLTLDSNDYWEAVRSDCESVWSTVEPGVLYWIPGTRIIGAISFDPPGSVDCSVETPRIGAILDRHAHGTWVASRAVGRNAGACPDCKIVMVQSLHIEGSQWAASNADWIDLQSNSWDVGLTNRLPGPDGAPAPLFQSSSFAASVEEAAQKHFMAWAAGNGLFAHLGFAPWPIYLEPRLAPSVVVVGGHDSGRVNLWPNVPPHVVADSCKAVAAAHQHLTDLVETGAGTSFSAPFASGGAAQILLEARKLLGETRTGVRGGIAAEGFPLPSGPLSDGRLRLDEWKEVFLKTATSRPRGDSRDGPACEATYTEAIFHFGSLPVTWAELPDAYPEYVHIGYGAIDGDSMTRASSVTRGETDLPARPETDAFFDIDRRLREARHEIHTGLP